MKRIASTIAVITLAGATLVGNPSPASATEICANGEVSTTFRATSIDTYCLRPVEANEVLTLIAAVDDLGMKYSVLYAESDWTIQGLRGKINVKNYRIKILRQQLKDAGIQPLG